MTNMTPAAPGGTGFTSAGVFVRFYPRKFVDKSKVTKDLLHEGTGNGCASVETSMDRYIVVSPPFGDARG